MSESGLILPASCRKQVQMTKAVVFWHSKSCDHIICAGHPTAKPPHGYVRIECVHAHEVELWSNRLRAQEKRIREMNDEEYYQYEDKILVQQIDELKRNLENSHDKRNRIFISLAIEAAEKQREKRRPVHIQRETFMAAEAEEGVAS